MYIFKLQIKWLINTFVSRILIKRILIQTQSIRFDEKKNKILNSTEMINETAKPSLADFDWHDIQY